MANLDGDATLLRLAEASIPRENKEEPLFPLAWHAWAFALIVALVESNQLAWGTFQTRLVSHLREHLPSAALQPESAINHHYFESWLEAAEETLVEEGFLAGNEIVEREKQIRLVVAQVRQEQISPRT